MRIVITGATGKVGSEISQFIDAQQHQIVLALRDIRNIKDAARLKAFSPSAEAVYFDFEKPETFAPALKGADSLFLMRPPTAAKNLNLIVDEAIAANLQHIVYLSVLGADKNKLLPHRATEDYIKEQTNKADTSYSLLRASFFMQNLSTVHRADIKEHSDLFLPAGSGKTSFIDTRDIGAVAAKTLIAPKEHANKAYSLTGLEALNYYEVANIFSEVLERPITYTDPSVFEFISTLLKRRTPLPFVLVMSGIYTTVRFGLADPLYPDTAALLERDPISLRRFVADYQDCWQDCWH